LKIEERHVEREGVHFLSRDIGHGWGYARRGSGGTRGHPVSSPPKREIYLLKGSFVRSSSGGGKRNPKIEKGNEEKRMSSSMTLSGEWGFGFRAISKPSVASSRSGTKRRGGKKEKGGWARRFCSWCRKNTVSYPYPQKERFPPIVQERGGEKGELGKTP